MWSIRKDTLYREAYVSRPMISSPVVWLPFHHTPFALLSSYSKQLPSCHLTSQLVRNHHWFNARRIRFQSNMSPTWVIVSCRTIAPGCFIVEPVWMRHERYRSAQVFPRPPYSCLPAWGQVYFRQRDPAGCHVHGGVVEWFNHNTSRLWWRQRYAFSNHFNNI